MLPCVQVSAIVRAPPGDVFSNLVQMRRTEGLGVLMGARVVEKIDANTQVITQRWKPAGTVGGCASLARPSPHTAFCAWGFLLSSTCMPCLQHVQADHPSMLSSLLLQGKLPNTSACTSASATRPQAVRSP